MILNTGINADVSEAVFTKYLKKCIMNGSLKILILIDLEKHRPLIFYFNQEVVICHEPFMLCFVA